MKAQGRRAERSGEEAQEAADARFALVVDALLHRAPGVTHSEAGSRLFGSSSLKVHDHIFAMVTLAAEFVVKLPKARVDELVESGAGERFDAHRGRPMKEWLVVHSESDKEWLQLAREALAFVGT